MVSATKMREYLWVKGGIYLALALILSGALMLMASANMAYADTKTNDDGSKTETVTVKRTIVFSDGAGGQVADTVVQEATFTRTWYPDFEDAPEWQEVDFAAVNCPAVTNFRAGQTQVAAVTGVTPANASSKLKDVTVTYTRTTVNTGTVASGATSPTVTPPASSSTTSSSTTTVTPTAPTVSTTASTSSSSGLPGPVTTSTSTTATAQPTTPTTSTTASTSSSGLPGPATPTSSTTATTATTASTATTATTAASTSSSTLQAPVSTTTSTPASVATTGAPTGTQESANQEPQITDYAWQIGAAVLGAGLVGAIAYIATTRRKADTPPSDPGTPTPSA